MKQLKYSERHVQHLLNGIYFYDQRNYIRSDQVSETCGKMRAALRKGQHAQYRRLAKGDDICLCRMCHVPVHARGSQLCDGCWETKSRLRRSIFALWAETPLGRDALRQAEEDIHNALEGIL